MRNTDCTTLFLVRHITTTSQQTNTAALSHNNSQQSYKYKYSSIKSAAGTKDLLNLSVEHVGNRIRLLLPPQTKVLCRGWSSRDRTALSFLLVIFEPSILCLTRELRHEYFRLDDLHNTGQESREYRHAAYRQFVL